MAALEGFDITVSGADVLVGDGMVDGVAVEGATLTPTKAASNTALILVHIDGTTIGYTKGADSATPAMPDAAGTEVGLGSATVETVNATLPSMAGRGATVPASA